MAIKRPSGTRPLCLPLPPTCQAVSKRQKFLDWLKLLNLFHKSSFLPCVVLRRNSHIPRYLAVRSSPHPAEMLEQSFPLSFSVVLFVQTNTTLLSHRTVTAVYLPMRADLFFLPHSAKKALVFAGFACGPGGGRGIGSKTPGLWPHARDLNGCARIVCSSHKSSRRGKSRLRRRPQAMRLLTAGARDRNACYHCQRTKWQH